MRSNPVILDLIFNKFREIEKLRDVKQASADGPLGAVPDPSRIFGDDWSDLNTQIFQKMYAEWAYKEFVSKSKATDINLPILLILQQMVVLDMSAAGRKNLAQKLATHSPGIVDSVVPVIKQVVIKERNSMLKDYGILINENDLSTFNDPDKLIQYANENGIKFESRLPLDLPKKVARHKLEADAKKYHITFDEEVADKSLFESVCRERLKESLKENILTAIEELILKNKSNKNVLFVQNIKINDIHQNIDQYLFTEGLIDEIILSLMQNKTVNVTNYTSYRMTDAYMVFELKKLTDTLYQTLTVSCSDKDTQKASYAFETQYSVLRTDPFKKIDEIYAYLEDQVFPASGFEFNQQNAEQAQVGINIARCDAKIRFFSDYVEFLRELPNGYHTDAIDVLIKTFEKLLIEMIRIEDKIKSKVKNLAKDRIPTEQEYDALNHSINRCLNHLNMMEPIFSIAEKVLSGDMSSQDALKKIDDVLRQMLEADKKQKPGGYLREQFFNMGSQFRGNIEPLMKEIHTLIKHPEKNLSHQRKSFF